MKDTALGILDWAFNTGHRENKRHERATEQYRGLLNQHLDPETGQVSPLFGFEALPLARDLGAENLLGNIMSNSSAMQRQMQAQEWDHTSGPSQRDLWGNENISAAEQSRLDIMRENQQFSQMDANRRYGLAERQAQAQPQNLPIFSQLSPEKQYEVGTDIVRRNRSVSSLNDIYTDFTSDPAGIMGWFEEGDRKNNARQVMLSEVYSYIQEKVFEGQVPERMQEEFQEIMGLGATAWNSPTTGADPHALLRYWIDDMQEDLNNRMQILGIPPIDTGPSSYQVMTNGHPTVRVGEPEGEPWVPESVEAPTSTGRRRGGGARR